MLVTTFYDSVFSGQFARRLRASAEALGQKCRIVDRSKKPELAGRSGWKAQALTEILSAYPGEAVLLMDPDSVISRRPDILLDEQDYDAAFYFDPQTTTLSGPVFLRDGERVRKVLRLWQERIRVNPESSDLENLHRVISHPLCPLVVRNLPVTYAWVERLCRERHPAAEPVLTHFWTDGLISSPIKIAQ